MQLVGLVSSVAGVALRPGIYPGRFVMSFCGFARTRVFLQSRGRSQKAGASDGIA